MNLTEFVVGLSITSILTLSGFGVAHKVSSYRVEGAAMRLFGMMNHARATAMCTGKYAGVFLEKDPVSGHTRFYRVMDGNGNGLRVREIEGGIDRKLGMDMWLERDFKGVTLETSGFSSGRIISFSPAFKSSTGSIYFGTGDPADSRIRIKLFGLSTITRPVRVFPDGKEVKL